MNKVNEVLLALAWDFDETLHGSVELDADAFARLVFDPVEKAFIQDIAVKGGGYLAVHEAIDLNETSGRLLEAF